MPSHEKQVAAEQEREQAVEVARRNEFHWDIALIALFVVGMGLYFLVPHFAHVRHWLALHVGIGTSPQAVYWYSWWSGTGSDLGEYALATGVVMGVIHTARKHNCGVHGCWRINRYEYEMDGVKHQVCKHHHPALGKGHKLRHEHLLQHHQDRLQSQT